MVASDHRRCPTRPKIPVVNAERCIGCGACENLCPARPFSAIYVEGHATPPNRLIPRNAYGEHNDKKGMARREFLQIGWASARPPRPPH